MNAKKELLEHIGDREVKYVRIILEKSCYNRVTIEGTLDEVLPKLDFDYADGYGGQYMDGTLWYSDGTWSVRREYDGSEWWEHRECPSLPRTSSPSTNRSPKTMQNQNNNPKPNPVEQPTNERSDETLCSRSCIVHRCQNRPDQGTFVGDLCKACWGYLTSGEIGPTTSFLAGMVPARCETRPPIWETVRRLERERDEARNMAEIWRDTITMGEVQYRGAPSIIFSWEKPISSENADVRRDDGKGLTP